MNYSKNSQVAASVPFDPTAVGFTATDVQAAIEEAYYKTPYSYFSATSTVSTTSGTYSVVSGLSNTPVAGTYIVIASCNTLLSGVNGNAEVAIFSAGSAVSGTQRQIAITIALLGLITLTTSTIISDLAPLGVVTVNGSQQIDVRFRSNDGQSITIGSRTMTLIRVA